ncbi:type II secretion system protein [Thiocystis violascens]|uniref:Prepilin-type N-terminal cleavage/methylation domain-containing protein n=1 Tax=Thiocystis violascens (strain ATCC 17096 / DSM 198 / 6111) TaxID=765911 RepID=I3Y5J5_THIV6|nr:prepilin-type N-terminal cleavage/methylation domain-containing protein [Thiocystis violascens]AFL72263.1 prepilin-type N-terminal cleavage/methylation domain-containing protein [Thiocystis violascens DSM 198]
MKFTRIAKLATRLQSRRAKRGQKGFTLLELLVVVAILAAIAGTATIALQDTDARASAAAHVAMMDELNKGIATYRVLNRNVLPSDWDSLLQVTTVPTLTNGATDDVITGAEWYDMVAFDKADFTITALPNSAAAGMFAGGIEGLRYVAKNSSFTPEDSSGKTCATPEALILARTNAVVPGNIYLSPDANGCGFSYNFPNDGSDFSATAYGTTGLDVAIWTGNYERILGSSGALSGSGTVPAGKPIMMAVGIGPSSTLFKNGTLGSMTSVPVYRHVSGAEYNRFIALFQVGTTTEATVDAGSGAVSDGAIGATLPTWEAADQVNLVTVIDGAGDTKEEELGEWDGSRNTI